MEEAYTVSDLINTQGFELNIEARAQADLKFTYVVSCQIYGQQKQKKTPEAADIALLLQRLTTNIALLLCCFFYTLPFSWLSN
jgi:callose synthase